VRATESAPVTLVITAATECDQPPYEDGGTDVDGVRPTDAGGVNGYATAPCQGTLGDTGTDTNTVRAFGLAAAALGALLVDRGPNRTQAAPRIGAGVPCRGDPPLRPDNPHRALRTIAEGMQRRAAAV
jgi:hypothetical protein